MNDQPCPHGYLLCERCQEWHELIQHTIRTLNRDEGHPSLQRTWGRKLKVTLAGKTHEPRGAKVAVGGREMAQPPEFFSDGHGGLGAKLWLAPALPDGVHRIASTDDARRVFGDAVPEFIRNALRYTTARAETRGGEMVLSFDPIAPGALTVSEREPERASTGELVPDGWKRYDTSGEVYEMRECPRVCKYPPRIALDRDILRDVQQWRATIWWSDGSGSAGARPTLGETARAVAEKIAERETRIEAIQRDAERHIRENYPRFAPAAAEDGIATITIGDREIGIRVGKNDTAAEIEDRISRTLAAETPRERFNAMQRREQRSADLKHAIAERAAEWVRMGIVDPAVFSPGTVKRAFTPETDERVHEMAQDAERELIERMAGAITCRCIACTGVK